MRQRGPPVGLLVDDGHAQLGHADLQGAAVGGRRPARTSGRAGAARAVQALAKQLGLAAARRGRAHHILRRRAVVDQGGALACGFTKGHGYESADDVQRLHPAGHTRQGWPLAHGLHAPACARAAPSATSATSTMMTSGMSCRQAGGGQGSSSIVHRLLLHSTPVLPQASCVWPRRPTAACRPAPPPPPTHPPAATPPAQSSRAARTGGCPPGCRARSQSPAPAAGLPLSR